MGLFDSVFGGGTTSSGSWGVSPMNKVISNPVGDTMREVISEMLVELFSPDAQKNRNLEDGDVVGVSRGTYDHYGVYVGNNHVIHYSSGDSDTSSNNRIIETQFSKFSKGSNSYFILNLEYLEPRKYSRFVEAEMKGLLSGSSSLFGGAIRAWQKCAKREVFDPQKTITRAKSRLGEHEYNLILNNCEHFAIWCKTGISQSHQIDAILKGTPRIIVN